MMTTYLAETPILDFGAASVQSVVEAYGWRDLGETDRIGAIHDFVRDGILFGYNSDDSMSASRVLNDGYGQCNTKAILMMALLRAVGIPCRFHGFTIDRGLQRGIVPELVYVLAPNDILHSWVEVLHAGTWLEIEGFILDQGFLSSLQARFPDRNDLCAYGAGTDNLQRPDVVWLGKNTYIQRTGISGDLGVFDTPDAFYEAHRQFSGLRGLLYRRIVRHWMNRRVASLRQGHVPVIPGGEENLLSQVAKRTFGFHSDGSQHRLKVESRP